MKPFCVVLAALGSSLAFAAPPPPIVEPAAVVDSSPAAEVSRSGGRSSWPGPDGFGYSGQSATYSWVDISATGAWIGLGNTIPIGFPFPFYDTLRTQLFVSSKGYLSFGVASADPSPDCPLPSAQAPDDLIALMWDDLSPSNTSSSEYYQTFAPGSCPYGGFPRACFIVQYENVCHAPGGPGCDIAGTFEAILFEGGDIVMQFKDTGTEQGAFSTTGIEGHNPVEEHGLTFACGTPGSLTDSLAIRFVAPTGVRLYPSDVHAAGCAGVVQQHTFDLVNTTGGAGTFTLSYDVPSGNGTLSGPPDVTISNNASASFTVELTPDECLQGESVTAVVTATGNAATDSTNLTSEIATHTFESVPSSAPVWAGTGHPVDGCTARDASGHWVTYVLGDAAGSALAGLWAYDHDANSWFQPSTTGTPDDRWAPDWAYDPDSNLCYLTGGWPLSLAREAFEFDPSSGMFTTLPAPDVIRYHHASWVATIDGVRRLCVGGGIIMVQFPGYWSSFATASTQCYDLDTAPAAWEPENAILGPLPDTWLAMADGVNRSLAADQLWIAAGSRGNHLSDEAVYWDDADDQWHAGGATGIPMSGTEGEFFQGRFFVFGGFDGFHLTSGTALRAHFDGFDWLWERLPDLPNDRDDTVVAAIDDEVRVVDGWGSAASDYVDSWQPCPSCSSSGWLEGVVTDADSPPATPSCTPASLTITPPAVTYWTDPGTGEYGPIEVHEGDPMVLVEAPGYAVVGPTAISIVSGVTTTRDFQLERPRLDLPLSSFTAVAPVGGSAELTLPVINGGHQPLDWSLIEVGALSWLDEAPASGTLASMAVQEVHLSFTCSSVGSVNGALSLEHNDPCRPPENIEVGLSCLDNMIFYDGFENDTTDAWSSVVP